MKFKWLHIVCIVGIVAFAFMFKNHFKEELVIESASESGLDPDKMISKSVFDTATFGMG